MSQEDHDHLCRTTPKHSLCLRPHPPGYYTKVEPNLLQYVHHNANVQLSFAAGRCCGLRSGNLNASDVCDFIRDQYVTIGTLKDRTAMPNYLRRLGYALNTPYVPSLVNLSSIFSHNTSHDREKFVKEHPTESARLLASHPRWNSQSARPALRGPCRLWVAPHTQLPLPPNLCVRAWATLWQIKELPPEVMAIAQQKYADEIAFYELVLEMEAEQEDCIKKILPSKLLFEYSMGP